MQGGTERNTAYNEKWLKDLILYQPFASCICLENGDIFAANGAFRELNSQYPGLIEALRQEIKKQASPATLPTNGLITLRSATFHYGLNKAGEEDCLLVSITEVPKTKSLNTFNPRLFDSLPSSILVTDRQGKLVFFNRSAGESVFNIFGITLQEGSNIRDFKSFIRSGNFESSFAAALKGNTVTELFEVNIQHGQTWLDVSFIPMMNEDQKTEGCIIFTEHISKRTSGPKEYQKWNLLTQQSILPTMRIDMAGHITWCNKAYESLTGYRSKELTGKDFFTLLVNAEASMLLLKSIRNRFEKGISFSEEIKFHKKNRQAFWSRIHASPFFDPSGKPGGYTIIQNDISPEKLAQTKLENQLQQKEGILKAIPDLIFRVRRDGLYLECHAFNKTDLLIPARNIPGTNFFDMPETMELKNKVWAKIQKVLNTGKIQVAEYERKNTNGQLQHYEARITKSGPDEVIYFVRNITQRKEALDNLANSEKKWRSIVENGFDGIALVDSEGVVQYITPNIFHILGYTAKEIIGRKKFQDFKPDYEFSLNQVLDQIKNSRNFRARTEQEIRSVKGETRYLEFSIISMLNVPGVEAIVINFRDVSDRRKFEQELIRSNANLNSVLNNTNDLIWLVDKDENILTSNKSFDQAFRHTPGKEKTAVSEVLPFYGDIWQPNYRKAWKGGKRISFFIDLATGQTREVSLYPVKDPDGKIVAVSGYSKDITFKKRYEEKIKENEKTISTILQTTSAGIMILANNRIRYVNSRCSKMLGYSNRELLNSDLSAILHPDYKKTASVLSQQTAEEKQTRMHYEVKLTHKSGEHKWFDLSSDIIEYSGESSIIVTLTDITDQKNYEAKLIEAKERAEELTQLKSGFLANMSHEIRTPLNGVLGLAEIIGLSNDLEEIKQMVELQKTSGQRLLSTLTSILELARLEAENKSITLHKVEVNQLLSELARTWKAEAQLKNLEILYAPYKNDMFCLADETMLYQVFNNLVSNALKFTEKGGIYISSSIIQERNNKYICIKVKDTGIGVSGDFAPRIFETFTQESHSSARRHGGSGLGLAIAKKYLGLLNGDISLTSKKGEGSIFSVILPYRN